MRYKMTVILTEKDISVVQIRDGAENFMSFRGNTSMPIYSPDDIDDFIEHCYPDEYIRKGQAELNRLYHGAVSMDWYGRPVPKHAHGTKRLDHYTSSSKYILEAVKELFDTIVDHNLLTRRITICFTDFLNEDEAAEANKPEVVENEQLDFFTDYDEAARQAERERQEQLAEARERNVQQAINHIKEKFGKNAVLKAMNLEAGATSVQRNMQIGGHRS